MIVFAVLVSSSFGLSKAFSWFQPREWALLAGIMAVNSFFAVYPLNKLPSKDPAVVYLWGSFFRLFPVAILLVWTARTFSQNITYYLIAAMVIYISFLLVEIRQLQKSISPSKATK
jgi:hypothetical protein